MFASVGASKFGGSTKLSTPVIGSMVSLSASSMSAREKVTSDRLVTTTGAASRAEAAFSETSSENALVMPSVRSSFN